MDTKDLQHSDSVQDEQQHANSESNEIVNSEITETEIKPTTAESENSQKDEKLSPELEKQKDSDAEDDDVTEFTADENDSEELQTDDHRLEVDYTKWTREDLVKELSKIVTAESINNIRKEVEAIKASFYKKQKVLNEQNRKEFLSTGGNIDEFISEEDSVEAELKDVFKRYRRLKAEFNRQIEKVKDVNLDSKYSIIEELKELINKDESIGDTFKEFRELQQRWKESGPVPQQKLKDLWSTYHHHVEKFYDYVNINKELRDLDLKKNLEIKIELCEKAEQLVDEPSVVSAFKTLQKYHNQWREVGPAPNDQKEATWERFKEATRIVNKKHQDYFKSLKDDQKNNLERKEKICEQAEEISAKELASHKEWTENTEQILELQKVWRSIGFAPKKDNNKIYARFRNACDKFFSKKRDFYSQNKELQDDNLQKKIELANKAELLQNSTDWKKTTKDLINLQKEWKEVGPVSRKQSDKIWKKFRAACDHFFSKKSEYYENIEQEYDKNLKLKQDLIEQVKNYPFTDDPNVNFEALKKYQEEFSELGFVPYKLKDKIQNEFREELNKQFDKLKIGDKEKKLFKFQTRLETMQNKPKSENKIRHEREKFFNKIRKLESDISVLENNIGFFSTDSEQGKLMLKDYEGQVESAKKEILVLEEKIRMIDKSDSE